MASVCRVCGHGLPEHAWHWADGKKKEYEPYPPNRLIARSDGYNKINWVCSIDGKICKGA
jgi:hypothetical protein